MNRILVLLLFGSLATLFSCEEPARTPISLQANLFPVPKKPPLDPQLQAFVKEYDRYFTDSMRLMGAPGAAVVIVKDSMVIFQQGYGVRSADGYDPVDEHTVFRIGSLSKGFAGVLTGILVERGVLQWNDRVQQYVPDFKLRDPEQAARIEIWHLLSHTTGLPYHAFSNLIEEGFDRHTIVSQYFPTSRLFGKEGEFFGYQNTAFCVIEPVLETAAGQPYQALLKRYIFETAGMKNASASFQSMRKADNKALPHIATAAGWSADTISSLFYDFAAAGGVNASISDMGKWLLVLLGKRPSLVDGPTLDRVFTPVIRTGKERRILPGWIDRDSASYALGWRILEHGGDTIVYHAGMVNNFHGEIALDRRAGIGICVLFNANTPLRGNCIRAFFQRWKNHFSIPQPVDNQAR
jgi:beta-lactamase class C